MRQAGARPGGGTIFTVKVLGSARDVIDDRRINITVAQLRADHFVYLALLDIGNLRQTLARGMAGGRRLPQLRPAMRALLSISQGRISRGPDVALPHLAPLDLIGSQQLRTTPTLECGGKLP